MDITYAIDIEIGLVISRVGNEVAIPILRDGLTLPLKNFELSNYTLKKIDVLLLLSKKYSYRWTEEIPTDIKNTHRKFWGMKPLKAYSH